MAEMTGRVVFVSARISLWCFECLNGERLLRPISDIDSVLHHPTGLKVVCKWTTSCGFTQHERRVLNSRMFEERSSSAYLYYAVLCV